jgi:hypothetical protein
MCVARCRFSSVALFASLLGASFLGPSFFASARANAAQPPASQPAYDSATYDQIVRLSLVEGDVRVSRGKQAERATGGDWGQAATGLPIEEGFSLATGAGRAEIEFEDASTA